MTVKKRVIELKPIKESGFNYDAIEAAVIKLLKQKLYYPVLKAAEEPKTALTNAKSSALRDAIRVGRVTFWQGSFKGVMSAAITRELRALGAVYDRNANAWRILREDLPLELRNLISASEHNLDRKLARIDAQLAQISPAKIADAINLSQHFDKTIWQLEGDFQASVKGITIVPTLTPAQVKQISQEWENNAKLTIQTFTRNQIADLRTEIRSNVFSGSRYGNLTKTIQDNYGVSASKAKFLARQETNLLTTKLKETRYVSAGITEYKWGCVAGTAKHPVRKSHKSLEGKTFSWSNPPITSEDGQPVRRNNPGQDYNCRCFAKPVVRF